MVDALLVHGEAETEAHHSVTAWLGPAYQYHMRVECVHSLIHSLMTYARQAQQAQPGTYWSTQLSPTVLCV